jgi:hypothetical protein
MQFHTPNHNQHIILSANEILRRFDNSRQAQEFHTIANFVNQSKPPYRDTVTNSVDCFGISKIRGKS